MTIGSAGRILAVTTALCVLSSTVAQGAELRIDNVTIVSPEQSAPRRNATVHIKHERIVSITDGKAAKAASTTTVIDGAGLYLSPGLIDSHVHLTGVPGMFPEHVQAHPQIAATAEKQIPRSFLYFGFTGLLDLLSTPEEMRHWQKHELRPDTYFCGSTPVQDGYPMTWTPKPQRYEHQPYMIIQRGDEAAAPSGFDPAKHTPTAVVARIKADGASCVKTFFEPGFGLQKNLLPTPRPDTLQELISAAHAAGLPVFMHANSLVAQEAAVNAGVDVIAHGLWHADDGADPNPVLDRIVKANIGWQPTIQVLYGELDVFDPGYLADSRLSRVLPKSLIDWYRTTEGQAYRDHIAAAQFSGEKDPEAALNKARAFYASYLARNRNATGYLAARNARFLFGTDTPSSPTYANPPGLNGWIEMQRQVEAGLTPAQIFKAATLSNAAALGLEREVGSVQAGRIANLLLLRKNPAETVDAYDEIVTVILRGRVIDRAELAANR
ncbi:amidohydrolase family protein [Peristeroidobacter agariperforans]|uniref:amidohydrolase family protein n=1 Tax=Peristeroidobacter agariperforans TaxID=268404 RepID=UPI00101BDAC3|nr:amidohydrolase family protein [Peristeroidobacter agariperforans]